MRNHRVHGVSVLPGVVFLDIVCRILIANGRAPGSVELSRIIFSEAVTTTDRHDREIRLSTKGSTIIAESRWLDGTRPFAPWRENFQAQLGSPAGKAEPEPPRERAVVHERSMADMYAYTAARRISHGPAMRCAGTLRQSSSDLVADLELVQPNEMEKLFHLHPAKLDAATIVAYGQNDAALTEPFIPMFVSSFRAPRPLLGAFTVHIPRRERLTAAGELFHSDVLMFDEHGRFAAEIAGLTCKRIRQPELIRKLVAEVDQYC
ncbi:MAG: polyketide synthase dehydratase domain-containing protein [Umezawaea sp.]